MTKPFFLFILFYVFLFSVKSFAADKLKIQRLTQEIQFDGKPDELAWQLIDSLQITMHSPVFNGNATERTDVIITYDGIFYGLGQNFW